MSILQCEFFWRSPLPLASVGASLFVLVLLLVLVLEGEGSLKANRGRLGWATVSPLLALLFLLATPSLQAAPKKKSDTTLWEQSVVTLEVSRKQYDYYEPWSRRVRRLAKVGVVVGERQILTTADEMYDRTLVRLQKNGHGGWAAGEVSWIDYPANLALVTTREESFWRGLKPAVLGDAVSAELPLQILRWREGKLENRKAEFTQFTVREGQLAPINQAIIQVDSEIQGVGWGEPLVANSHVVGLLSSQDSRTCMAIPASFIQGILEAHRQGKYRGLGYFDFYWQPAENPATLASLKLPGEPRGVLVTEVPARKDGCAPVLQPRDILLRVDGFDLDIQGNYNDPEFGPLMLENLATRHKWAGATVKIQLWREGKMMDVSYQLPKFEYTNSLVPVATFDQEPEYLIVGGLVFQPLTETYLESWGKDWKQRAPFRLSYFENQEPKKDSSGLVLLSQVLPDAYNIGYQEQKWLVVDKVNGQRISRLTDLQRALAQPVDGYHVIDFIQSDSLRRMVLSAGQSEQAATARVLKRYGISEACRLAAGASARVESRVEAAKR